MSFGVASKVLVERGKYFRETLLPDCLDEETVKKSDVILNYNHDRSQVLARSKYGEGTLGLEVRTDGLYFSAELPNTQFGDEILEQVQRGDVCYCSFCFDVRKEDDEWQVGADGIYERSIHKISNLYDVSLVVDPAYDETYVEARSRELTDAENDINNDMTEDEKTAQAAAEQEETAKAQAEQEETRTEEETAETDEKEETEESTSEETEERAETEEEETEEQAEEQAEESASEDEDEEQDEEQEEETRSENADERKKILTRNTTMKKFSLAKAILDVAENRSLDAVSQKVIAAANERNANLAISGQIQLPAETRSLTVEDEGEDVVAVEIQGVLEPLRAKNIVSTLGAKFLTGLSSDIQIPVMTAASTSWAGENAEAAADASLGFGQVKMSAHRITTTINLSKQLLIQATPDVEGLVYDNIINSLNTKLEETIFGAGDGSDDAPKGLTNGAEVADVTNFKSLLDIEATVEEAGVTGECKYAISPKAKAKLRNMNMSGKTTRLVLENGEIDGTAALSTGNIKDDVANVIYGDFSNYAVAQFGPIDITIDPYTRAKYGEIVMTLNAYFDCKPLRKEAFAFGKA